MNVRYILLLFFMFFNAHADGAEATGNGLSYEHYINSKKPIKCLYGYVAEKTGGHEAAIMIFEDCIKRWNSVYSMIWLAQMYETGVAVEQNLEYATALMKRGAEADDEAGYSSLAKYHYGIALFEGKGTEMNQPEGIKWLQKSLEEGVEEAKTYLSRVNQNND